MVRITERNGWKETHLKQAQERNFPGEPLPLLHLRIL
jgi:hypothetical protein